MTKKRKSRENPEVRDFILRHVVAHPTAIAGVTAARFGISRNAINGYVARLMAQGLLTGAGRTKARTYGLKNLVLHSAAPAIKPGLSEDAVWRENLAPAVKNLPAHVIDICRYGFAATFSNILDHSGSSTSLIKYRQTYAALDLTIADQGVGIFEKIRRDFGLADARAALLELSKGRLTSDKVHHSGEGLFLAARMFDQFNLASGRLLCRWTQTDSGWQVEARELEDFTPGTVVRMNLATDTARSIGAAMQAHAASGRAAHVPVRLLQLGGEALVSRSQAKSLLGRAEDFSEFALDFAGVEEIGQAFADEIFRVFAAAHPAIAITAHNASTQIQGMIAHAQAELVRS